jgi:hypothetical protein
VRCPELGLFSTNLKHPGSVDFASETTEDNRTKIEIIMTANSITRSNRMARAIAICQAQYCLDYLPRSIHIGSNFLDGSKFSWPQHKPFVQV